jgi:hypothetical protein
MMCNKVELSRFISDYWLNDIYKIYLYVNVLVYCGCICKKKKKKEISDNKILFTVDLKSY